MEPLFFQATLNAGQEYQVQALDFSPTEAQLRAAGQDYPAWVGERYLQAPPDLSPRVRALAGELTAEALTPYDKAQAITDWLRAAIRYNEHLPAPPADREMLEWLLFDSRQGFCTYAATAEVILLRAVGVPARLAVGYAEGEIPPSTLRTRLVRQSHAHAWPEVYFPGIGWVEFEPTCCPESVAPSGRRKREPWLSSRAGNACSAGSRYAGGERIVRDIAAQDGFFSDATVVVLAGNGGGVGHGRLVERLSVP